MNLTIESLNLWGMRAREFAWPVLWQSSLLIGLLFTLDFALRRRVRAAVRYALWLVVLLKLVLPPALALPTGLSWWLRPAKPAPKAPPVVTYTVTYGPAVAPTLPEPVVPMAVAPMRAALSPAAWALLVSSGVSLGLLGWMLLRWGQVARDVRQAGTAPQPLRDLLEEARHSVGLRRAVRLGLMERPMSPAVCGVFRPRILLPRSLAEQLPPAQLRAILVHELIHLRRGDVWVNCAQALLQLLYWWHPLLWLANARIRQVREEAVDDAVMAALGEHAEAYAPTLLEVARLALRRPLTSRGLVGILESRSSLRQRIQRLLEFHPPRRAGLTLASALVVLAFAAVAVPMGEAPAPTTPPTPAEGSTNSLGSEPSTNTTSVDSKRSAATLVHNGMKLLYQRGELDAASTNFNQALALDPQNQAARYLTNQVAQVQSGKATIHTNENRETLLKKLNTLKLDEVRCDGLPLSEVVINLNKQIRKRDPEKRGINFIINPNVELGVAASPSAPGAIDPTTGLPVGPTAAAADQRVNIGTALVKLSPPLTNVTLEQALDAIVQVANIPIKYSVADYAVIFSPRLGTAPALFTRTFRVDPYSLLAALSGAGGASTNAAPQTVSERLRNLFATLGVEIEPPKSLFFKDREGMLLVRATPEDLDTIEQVLHQLTPALSQIHLACQVVEVAQFDPKPYGFDWYLGNAMFTASNSVPATLLAPVSSPRAGLGPKGNAGFTLTGVLTDPQYRVVLHALDQREGADVLAAPQVVTLSGRQVQCKVTQEFNVLKGIKPQALTSPGVPTDETNAFYKMEPVECGPMLDIVPVLLADGVTVNLTVIASMIEFLGYQQPTNRVRVYVDGKPTQVEAPLPTFHVAQVSSVVNVWDGQTVVLGGMVSERVLSQKDSVPVLGSLPLAGALFRKESRTTQKRNLMVFITATLVDAAGNRVHSEDEMPFARNAIPVQPKH